MFWDVSSYFFINIYLFKNNFNLKLLPGEFCENAKAHKLSINNVDDLTLRPIVSNIDTATYETAKYWASLLAPLGKSEFTFSNTKKFVK